MPAAVAVEAVEMVRGRQAELAPAEPLGRDQPSQESNAIEQREKRPAGHR